MITFPCVWARWVPLGGLSWCFSSRTVMWWLRLELIEGSTGLDIQVSFVSQITDFSAEMIWTRAGNRLVNISPLFFSPSGVPFLCDPFKWLFWASSQCWWSQGIWILEVTQPHFYHILWIRTNYRTKLRSVGRVPSCQFWWGGDKVWLQKSIWDKTCHCSPLWKYSLSYHCSICCLIEFYRPYLGL